MREPPPRRASALSHVQAGAGCGSALERHTTQRLTPAALPVLQRERACLREVIPRPTRTAGGTRSGRAPIPAFGRYLVRSLPIPHHHPGARRHHHPGCPSTPGCAAGLALAEALDEYGPTGIWLFPLTSCDGGTNGTVPSALRLPKRQPRRSQPRPSPARSPVCITRSSFCSIGHDELAAAPLLRDEREHAGQPVAELRNGRHRRVSADVGRSDACLRRQIRDSWRSPQD
jgi:hypothetical protein